MAMDGAADLGQLVDEVVDGLAGLRPDDDQGPEPGQRRGQQRPGGFESLQPNVGRPVACKLADAAQLLGVPVARVREAAEGVEPYRANDGSLRWSLMLLERALGRGKRARHGSAWRGRAGTVARPRPPDPSD